jgi:hypothetical protein
LDLRQEATHPRRHALPGDHANRTVYMGMTKDQIKQAPDYDDAMTTSDDAYYDKYSDYYSPYWS